MHIFYLEDHEFFAEEVIEYLQEIGHCVTFVSSWEDAQRELSKGSKFDMSILDVILKNGKTGFQFAEQWKENLGRILFLTGCVDDVTINAVNRYGAISKLTKFRTPLKMFIDGEKPIIE
jgi:DNA-binding response OmpR family regulator